MKSHEIVSSIEKISVHLVFAIVKPLLIVLFVHPYAKVAARDKATAVEQVKHLAFPT